MLVPARNPLRAPHWIALALLLGAWAIVGAMLPADAASALDWRPARSHEAWRWFSAVAVHHSALHLGANVLGVIGVALLGSAGELPPRSAVAWFLAWPATHGALLMQPELTYYAGLSGVLHAGVAVAGVHLLWQRRGAQRLIGAALLAALVIKVGVEAPWRAVLVRPAGWDVDIAPAAHAAGALAGAACAALLEMVQAPRLRGGRA